MREAGLGGWESLARKGTVPFRATTCGRAWPAGGRVAVPLTLVDPEGVAADGDSGRTGSLAVRRLRGPSDVREPKGNRPLMSPKVNRKGTVPL